MITALEFDYAIAARKATRARRIALIAASVPELVRRTRSIEGNASIISAASSISSSVGAP